MDGEEQAATRSLVLSVCDLKQMGDSPPARIAAQSVVIGTRLYMYGGADENLFHDEVFLLEIEQMKWSKLKKTFSKNYFLGKFLFKNTQR